MADTESKNSNNTTTTVAGNTAIIATRQYQESYINADIENNSDFRPFSSGMQNINTGVATIILFKDGATQTTADENYRTKVSTNVKSPSEFDNSQIPVLPGVAENFIGVFKNFSLIQYGEDRQEAMNIQRTFGREWVAFFFGEAPRVYKFSGHFLDYEDYPHYEQFMKAYDLYLRGTKCLENKITLYISYDGRLVKGLITGISTGKSSGPGIPTGMVGFNFNLLVMGDRWIRNSNRNMGNIEILNALSNSGTQAIEQSLIPKNFT